MIPAFEHALLVRISQLLITRLQNLLDPAGEPAAHTLELKVVLRVTRTTLKNFYLQLHSKCGVFVEALIAGGQHEQKSHGICIREPAIGFGLLCWSLFM